MRPKPIETESELEARRAAILAENDERDARIDERPFDLNKELGIDWKSKELRGYKPSRKR